MRKTLKNDIVWLLWTANAIVCWSQIVLPQGTWYCMWMAAIASRTRQLRLVRPLKCSTMAWGSVTSVQLGITNPKSFNVSCVCLLCSCQVGILHYEWGYCENLTFEIDNGWTMLFMYVYSNAESHSFWNMSSEPYTWWVPKMHDMNEWMNKQTIEWMIEPTNR